MSFQPYTCTVHTARDATQLSLCFSDHVADIHAVSDIYMDSNSLEVVGSSYRLALFDRGFGTVEMYVCADKPGCAVTSERKSGTFPNAAS